jgi:hypothetical protein
MKCIYTAIIHSFFLSSECQCTENDPNAKLLVIGMISWLRNVPVLPISSLIKYRLGLYVV